MTLRHVGGQVGVLAANKFIELKDGASGGVLSSYGDGLHVIEGGALTSATHVVRIEGPDATVSRIVINGATASAHMNGRI